MAIIDISKRGPLSGRLRPRQADGELDIELVQRIMSAIGSTGLRGRRRLLEAFAQIERDGPTDLALAEHLEASLSPAERAVVALRATRKVRTAWAAGALRIPAEELAELESSACEQAVNLTLAYHDDSICEPAALAAADHPQARIEAVRTHLGTCKTCRAEFGARVAYVLEHAGSLVETQPVAPVD